MRGGGVSGLRLLRGDLSYLLKRRHFSCPEEEPLRLFFRLRSCSSGIAPILSHNALSGSQRSRIFSVSYQSTRRCLLCSFLLPEKSHFNASSPSSLSSASFFSQWCSYLTQTQRKPLPERSHHASLRAATANCKPQPTATAAAEVRAAAGTEVTAAREEVTGEAGRDTTAAARREVRATAAAARVLPTATERKGRGEETGGWRRRVSDVEKRFFSVALNQERRAETPAVPAVSYHRRCAFDEAAEAQAAAAAAARAAAEEIRCPVRVLRTSCTDILRNLAIESMLIDVCGRSEAPAGSHGTSTAPSPATTPLPPTTSPHSSPPAAAVPAAVPAAAAAIPAAAAASEAGAAAVALDSRSVRAQSLQTMPVLFLWRNEKTIVIGRHQNAWKECDIRRMERDGVTLARRYSGGGAVYQDLGNTCFTFLDPAERHCKLRNSRILLHALRKKYNITGSFSGRNDLLTEDGRKFSGFAYSKFPRMWLHHGTLMREVDCEALARYLTPNKAKLESKGIESVAARVANLRSLQADITHEGLCEAIAASFVEQHGWPMAAAVEMEDIENLEVDGVPVHQHPLFKQHFDTLASWEWRFGHSPAFRTSLSTRFPWGCFEVHLNVEEAVIADIKIYSDCMHPDLVDALTATLRGCRYTAADLKTAISSITLEKPPADLRVLLEEFATWFTTETQQ